MRFEMIEVASVGTPLLEPRFVLDGPELDELADSMARIGLIQPIVVVATANGYRLVAGNRRLAAARRLGWSMIAAVIADLDEAGQVDGLVAENLHRLNLGAMEEAAMMAEIIDRDKLTHEVMAERMGKSRVWVTKRLSLLDLDNGTVSAVITGELSPSHALELRRIEDEPRRDYYRHLATKHGVTIPVLRDWISEELDRPRPIEEPHPAEADDWVPPRYEVPPIVCAVCDADGRDVILQTLFVCRACARRLEQAKEVRDVPEG